MIRYDRLWATMEAKGITQYRLIKYYSFSAGQIGRLKKNMHVSTHTLDTLCSILSCPLTDIVEYIPEGIPLSEGLPAAENLSDESSFNHPDKKLNKPPVKQKKDKASKGEKSKKTSKEKKSDKKASKDGKKGKNKG